MKGSRTFPVEHRAALERQLRELTGQRELQRSLCLWLCAVVRLPSSEIALALGVSSSWVRSLYARYLREGAAALQERRHGGRRRENLSRDEEREFLSTFLERRELGEWVSAREIK